MGPYSAGAVINLGLGTVVTKKIKRFVVEGATV